MKRPSENPETVPFLETGEDRLQDTSVKFLPSPAETFQMDTI
jgi:hypothetical protein